MIRLLAALDSIAGWRRLAVLALLGATAALGLPPLDFFPAFFIAMAFAMRLLDQWQGTWRGALLQGWALGAGYFIVAFHWIGFAFLVEADVYLWMMPFAVGGLAIAMAFYWALAVLVARVSGMRGLSFSVTLACSLAFAEWLRGHLFTGFPWAAPGQVADGLGSVLQIASFIGMTGLTLLLLAWSAAFAALFNSRERNVALLLLSLLPVTGAWGAYRLNAALPVASEAPLIRVVQPNIRQDDKWRDENTQQILETLLGLSRGDGSPARAVVWPESAVPFAIDESDIALAEISVMLGRNGTLVTGSLRRAGATVFNSVQIISADGRIFSTYDKWRLVPGGEFLPFEWLLEPLGFRRVVTVPGSFEAGEGPVSIALDGLPAVSPSVCYEAIFPHRFVDAANRPAWIANVTNDAWFGNSTGPHQHLAQLRLRAIEQGIPAFRSANTGISAIIDGYGRYLARLEIGVPGFIESRLPVALPVTVYGRFGDAILAIMIALAFMAVTVARFTMARWNH
jgi:apolipoprotein N-acyltransferase